MRPLHISGTAAISSAGIGASALAARVGTTDAHPGVPVEGLYDDVLPSPSGHALVDFDAREHLGRKGTSFFDRATALAVVACGDALRDAGLLAETGEQAPSTSAPARIGVALGTTVGSFKSTSDFSMETVVQSKPYLVNPVLFPNTVMNCAAGQVAIRYGLHGVNATLAGGPVAFLNALRYASNAIDRGYTETMLVGAVEEYTPHRAWMSALTPPAAVPAGEAAAAFAAGAARELAFAEVIAVAIGFGPSGRSGPALAECVRRALRQAGLAASEIALLATGEHAATDDAEGGPAREVLTHEPPRLRVARHFGDCGAATGAVALATVLALHQADRMRDGALTMITARSPEGAVGAAIVRGWSRGTDRG